jgi:SAM-dependent methyltransferase
MDSDGQSNGKRGQTLPLSWAGFDFTHVSAEDYDHLRPGYPREAVGWLVNRTRLGRSNRVLDLAAGTGHLSRLVAGAGTRVVALEPAANMRAKLREEVPGVSVVGGVAEAIPLGGGVADCVTVGQAFHHFHAEQALREIHRVLALRGSLALLWMRGDPTDPVGRALDEIIQRHQPESWTEYFKSEGWRDAFANTGLFIPVEERDFSHSKSMLASDLRRSLATSSDIASLPATDRSSLLVEVDRLAGRLPERVRLLLVIEVQVYRRG